MGEIVKLERKPEWLASFDLYRDPDGQLVCVLMDARTSLVESQPSASHEKLLLVADMVESGLGRMRANALTLKDRAP
jgi:hypothetical protein